MLLILVYYYRKKNLIMNNIMRIRIKLLQIRQVFRLKGKMCVICNAKINGVEQINDLV